MRHLGDRAADLVDGRLSHDARDRALAHLTVCEQCRHDVDMERFARAALRAMPDAKPSDALLAGLLSLADPSGSGGPPPPRRPSLPGPAQHPAGWPDHDPRAQSTAHRSRPRRVVRFAAAGAVSAGAMLVVLASLGAPTDDSEPPPQPAAIVPPIDQFAIEHARSTGSLPFAEPVSLLTPAGVPLGERR